MLLCLQIMNLHGIFPTEEELKEMIQMVDRNSNGTIDLDEFVQMMLNITKAIPEGENDIEQAFKIFDKVSTFYFKKTRFKKRWVLTIKGVFERKNT